EPEVERWLDLRTGIAGHRYHRSGAAVAHRSYASHPHSVLVHEIRAEAPVDVRVQVAPDRLRGGPAAARTLTSTGGALTGGEPRLPLQLPADVPPGADGAPVVYDERSRTGTLLLHADSDGRLTAEEGHLVLRGARRVRLLITTGTVLPGLSEVPGLPDVPG